MHTFNLSIDDITKIEGKAGLTVEVKDDKVTKCEFSITEYKRFYTQAIRGKDVVGLPQLTSRICGTCSNAHILCCIKAVENGLGITVSDQTRILRELVNYGLLIRDHALHLYVFALPDLLGIDSILDLDENDPKEREILDDTFAVKAAGNALSKVVAGRSIHAPFMMVGGFARMPDSSQFPLLIKQMESIRPRVLRLIERFQNCDLMLPQVRNFIALVDPGFTFLSGSVKSSDGKESREDDYGKLLEHTIIPYSEASGYKYDGKIYAVGALARLNLNKEALHVNTIRDTQMVLKRFPSQNIYDNNLAQAIEILHSIDKTIELLSGLTIRPEPVKPVIRKAGVGVGIIEAPRGSLYYRLEIDDVGKVIKGDIVVPTGQNQTGIERSIYEYISDNLEKDKHEMVHQIEKIVRSYDPCMSCASHFLKVNWTG